MGAPLRLRVRRTLLLRRPVGAIFLAYEPHGPWNGDLVAIRGAGHELTFRDWYERCPGG